MSPPLTPASLGYSMPAEWEPHEGTWLSWPKDPVTWPEQIEQVQRIYLEMIDILTAGEKVFLLVDDEKMEEEVRRKVAAAGIEQRNIIFHRIPTVDAWIRDYGPNFVVRNANHDRRIAFNDWIFNAWGDKYETLKRDDHVPELIAPLLKVPVFTPGLVLEGGSIDVNGCGTCLTTEQCLLAQTRNPSLASHEIEKALKDYLGVQNVIWLREGIAGDDTDGHVDDIARFTGPHTVVCAVEDDPSDVNYRPLRENHDLLKNACDESARSLTVVPLPMPAAVSYQGDRLPASYANFYIANASVLVPIFNDRNDAGALSILAELFPEREVRGIHCRDLVVGLGAIHCITQQQPAV